jgi:hypothetical protein
MATVHVYMSAQLRKRLGAIIETEGFRGPSEFFRFMIKYFEYIPPTPKKTHLDAFRQSSKISKITDSSHIPPKVRHNNRNSLFNFYPN